MTKKPFVVGDRVRVYYDGICSVDTITSVYPDGTLCFKQTKLAHPKQCRRLKAKRKPREWWINETRWRKDQPLSEQDVMSFAEWFENINGGYIITVPPEDTKGWLHVVEKFEKVKP